MGTTVLDPHGWYGVDLDGTLAIDICQSPGDVLAIGDPIRNTVELVKSLLAEGKQVRIFTARVGPASSEECYFALLNLPDDFTHPALPPKPPGRIPNRKHQEYFFLYQHALIEDWCARHLGVVLPITATKDFHMRVLYDDRAIQVISNTGITLQEDYDNYKAIVQEEAINRSERDA